MIWGLKSTIGKHIAYKHVWCNNCDCQQLANQFTKQTKLTLLWIPTLPIAAEKVWLCGTCEEIPNKKAGFAKILNFLLFIIAIFAVVIIVTELIAFSSKSHFELHFLWFSSAVLYLLFGLKYFYNERQPVHEVGSPFQVIPVSQIDCVYCHGLLESRPNLHCPKCELKVIVD